MSCQALDVLSNVECLAELRFVECRDDQTACKDNVRDNVYLASCCLACLSCQHRVLLVDSILNDDVAS